MFEAASRGCLFYAIGTSQTDGTRTPAFDDGLREKDVIVAIAGQPFHFATKQFNMHLKLNYKVGNTLPLTVLREGKRKELLIRLVE